MTLRFDRSVTALAAAILLAYGSVSDAQDTRSGAAAQPPAASRSAPAAQAMGDLRMSELVGMDVRNAKGENLGDVRDLVVDVDSGRVAYAVVGIGGFLGIGEKLSAFPMSAFKLSQASTRGAATRADRAMDNDGVKGDRGPIGSDRTAAEARAQGKAGPIDNDGVKGDKGPIGSDRASASGSSANRMLPGRGTGGTHLVLDADPQRLKRAPNFDRNQWPDWNDAKVRGDVDRAYGGTAPSGKAGHLVRASQLLDADIHDPQAKNVGEVEDLVVDSKTGNVRYAVIDFDQSWTPVDKLVAVPMKSLRATAERKELTFSGSKEQLQNAPSFDKGKWPDLNSGTFRGSVDRYSSSWRAAPESSTARNGTAATPGGSMTSAPTDRSRGSTASRSGGTGGGAADPAAGTQGGTGSR